MAEEPAEKEPPQGLLVKHSRVELLERGIDPADPKYTCEDLFGSVTGAAFLDMVYSRCGAGEHSVPWFITGSDGSRRRNIFRSPMSRPIQESTANAYKQRILKEGLSQLASGPAVFRFRDDSQTAQEVEAGTFNHRAEAFYCAVEESPEDAMIQGILHKGLVKVKFMRFDINPNVWAKFISTHNGFHQGSGSSVMDIAEEALSLEASWREHCAKTGSSNPKYQTYYESFVVGKSDWFKKWQPYTQALSLIHNLQAYQVWNKFKTWANANVDFLNPRMSPGSVISVMHEFTLLTVGGMKKLYDKVPSVSSGDERKLPWIFDRPSASNSKLMSLLLLPMSSSAAFRKLGVGLGDDANDDAEKPDEKANSSKVKGNDGITGIIESGLSRMGLGGAQSSDPAAGAEGAGDGDDQELAHGLGDDDGHGHEHGAKRRRTDDSSKPRGKALPTKKSLRQQWAGYSAEEKATYSSTVCSDDGAESRIKTSLDEILSALQFVMSRIRDASCLRDTERDLTVKQIKQRRLAEQATLQSTLGFCMSFFLEFCFESKVGVNGVQHRTYSALRSELQGIMQSAHETWNNTEETGGMDALSLAKLLCNTYANRPVVSLVWDDDEERSVKRVASVMTLQQSTLVSNLKAFLKNMHLPIMLHACPRDCLTAIASKQAMDLIDVISIIRDQLDGSLPFSWIAFAADVSDIFAVKQHFVESTEEVFGDSTVLSKFCSLRTRYLFCVLDEGIRMPGFKLRNAHDFPHLAVLLPELVKLEADRPDVLVSLSTCDMLLGAVDWHHTWHRLLAGQRDVKGLQSAAMAHMGLQSATLTQSQEIQQSSKPAPATAAASEAAEATEGTVEAGDDPDGRGKPGKPDPAVWDVQTINRFSVDGLFDAAAPLKLNLCATFVKRLQLKLEDLVYQVFTSYVREGDAVLVNISRKSSDMFSIRYPTPALMRLPFMGTVTQSAGGGGKRLANISLCSVCGLDFFLEAPSSVCVPAWSVKAVNRVDQAYFEMKTAPVKCFVAVEGVQGADDQVDGGSVTIADAAVGKGNFRHCEFTLKVTYLEPVEDLDTKLAKDLELAKAKAQKTAQNTVVRAMAASAKKKDKQAKPKPKGRPRSDAGERPADAAGVGELTMQQQVENIDKLVQQAVESCSLPTSLPITRLDESKARGSRTKALMEALRSSATPTPFEPESDLAAEKSEPRCLYGLAAAIAHGQQEGFVKVTVKKKAASGKPLPETVDLMKLGRHLLK
ncbi:unnamed protein product [Effrenium voratum]|nr:unnamed protein product [Effrenium voratum]